ncbi:MAG: flagellar filament capping protein FliD [Gammaproteobacteria bacterium]|nr:flagellar filament capping protein FliD [Gammaproteobacteria bacterium]
MVSAPGVGSGLDVNSLVAQLVAAERQPTANRINLAEARANGELSAVGQIKSALSSFQDSLAALTELENFQQRTVSLSSEDYISVSATSAAVKGSYDIEVQQVAEAQRIASIPYASAETVVGTGLMSFTVNGSSFAVNIVEGEDTLADIRDAINDAADNVGVQATIINADDGARLILSSAETGAANEITLASTGGNGLLWPFNFDPASGINPMTELNEGLDSIAVINGFTVTNDSNSVSDAVEGLDIDLLQAELGTTTSVEIGFDDTAANAALTSFVNAYNALASTIDQVTSFDAESGVAGALLGDSIVRDIESTLRRELSNVVGDSFTDPFTVLAEIGITTDLSGKLEIDGELSAAAIEQDFDAVGLLFADEDDGIAVRLDAIITGLLESDGSISIREDRLNDRLEDLTDQRERLDERMLQVEERLFRQFSALDTLLAQFQSTSSFLTSQLANLPTPRAPSNNS